MTIKEVAELNGDVTDNPDCVSNENALVDFYGPVEFYTMKDEYEAMGDDKDGVGEKFFSKKILLPFSVFVW